MTKARSRDQLLYALLAVLFAAIAVVNISVWSNNRKDAPKISQTQAVDLRTPDELMLELNKTVGDGGQSEFDTLRQEASSL